MTDMDETRAALVQNGSVVNVIIVATDADGAVDFVLEGYEIVVLPENSMVSPGWSYHNKEFTPPAST